MSLRLTGGELRGRLLGPVHEGVRPTSARAREALFSMLGQDLRGWSALDAFGGTGLLAFEAASRGAGPVLVVEREGARARSIREMAQKLGLGRDRLEVRVADAAVVLASGEWDLVMLDPPYAEDPAPWIARAAAATRRVLVMEHLAARPVPERSGGLALDRSRRYGDTSLTLYRPVVGARGCPTGT